VTLDGGSSSSSGMNWTSDACLQLDAWVSTTSGSDIGWGERMGKYINATGHAPVYPYVAAAAAALPS
jgi:hypothetical protein